MCTDLEDMIDVDSFSIRYVVEIIQVWFQVKEIFMEHLNNFNIISGIKSFTSLLTVEDILLLVQHLISIKYAITVIIYMYLGIETQIRNTKESSLLYHVHKVDHYIILVLTATVVNNNRNFRHIMVITVWFRIVPIVIETAREIRYKIVHPFPPLKIRPIINWTYVNRSITNTQAINIDRRQVICMSRMFTFEYWKKDILSHVHGNCNILCGGAWMLFFCMGYFIFESFLQIICLDYLQMWWKDVPLCFFALCILHLQSDINDDIRIISISINSIVIVIITIVNEIIWFSYDYFLRLS